jgi:crotonobetainyl-CoA:carnitine CoA-transferase CaiB-like acyl-CoA transferase
MGAEVIKVESPGEGDYMRDMGPGAGEYSRYFQNLNRGKKSIVLNLKKKAGVEAFLRLAAGAAVVVEGFRPGVMDSLGLGYQEVKKVSSGIIYCSISGYGQDGPYRLRAGHDINYIATAGILDISGREEPFFAGVQVADVGGGALMALTGILAGLYARTLSGQGCCLDVSMLDGLVSWLPMPLADLFAGNPVGRGQAPLNGGYACYNVYRTADGGYMSLGALEPKFWQQFCLAAGREDLIQRQYQDNQVWLKQECAGIFAARTRSEWENVLNNFDACCEPVLSLQEMTDNPQVRARGLVEQEGPAFPLKISGERPSRQAPAPLLGEHTRELLLASGYSDGELSQLAAEGVVKL